MSINTAMDCIESEYRHIQSYGIFNNDELTKFKTARVAFERQVLECSEVPLNTLNEYLEHLEVYLQTVRRRLMDWKCVPLSQRFMNDILKRMKILHEVRIDIYGAHDYALLAKYLKFCSSYDMIQSAKMYLSKEYPNNVNTWMVTTDVLVKEFQNNRIAIDFLTTALDNNKGNETLYKQIFRIELDAAARSSRKIYLDKCVSRLTEHLKTLLKENHFVDFYMEILNIILQYRFTTTLRQFYSEQILINFPNNPQIWHSLAQNELLDDDIRICGKIDTALFEKGNPVTKFTACVQKYQEGINALSTHVKPQLWFLYIDFLINTSLDITNKYGKELKCKTLKAALDEGCHFISEEQYLSWLERLNIDDTILLIRTALRVHPNSVKLWRARMHYESHDNESVETLNEIFQEGTSILKEKSFPLWDCYITFHILCSTRARIQAIYEEGIKEHEDISNELKPQYVEWLAETDGIGAARKFYFNIANIPPYCKQLHFALYRLEEHQSSYDFEIMESICELMSRQFKGDLSVWIKYVGFKVSLFNFKYKDDSPQEHLEELRGYLKYVRTMAKISLPVNAYAELKLHCLEKLNL